MSTPATVLEAKSTGKQFWNVPRIDERLLQIVPGASADAVGDLADCLMHCAERMLVDEVSEPDADRAFAIRFIVTAARACYRSIGVDP